MLDVPVIDFAASAAVTRLTRRKCPVCHYQRVLYRISLALVPAIGMSLLPLIKSERVACAPCWGIR